MIPNLLEFLLSKLLNPFRFRNARISFRTHLKLAPAASLHMEKGCTLAGRTVNIGSGSEVFVGEGSLIQGSIFIGENSRVVIGDNFQMLNHAGLHIGDNSQVTFGDDCLLEALPGFDARIVVDSGIFHSGNNCNFRGTVRVQGGDLKIGSNTFLNQGSEIRCEESVTIGDYVLISYFVDIFDTNTHSLDWRERQRETELGYPHLTVRDQDKSDTSPVSLGDHVWVGKWAAILKGCHIGDRSVVGTRTVVTKSCPDDSLLVGNPAKIEPLNR